MFIDERACRWERSPWVVRSWLDVQMTGAIYNLLDRTKRNPSWIPPQLLQRRIHRPRHFR
jgi:hypothetical protein